MIWHLDVFFIRSVAELGDLFAQPIQIFGVFPPRVRFDLHGVWPFSNHGVLQTFKN